MASHKSGVLPDRDASAYIWLINIMAAIPTWTYTYEQASVVGGQLQTDEEPNKQSIGVKGAKPLPPD